LNAEGRCRTPRILVVAPFPPRLDGMHGGTRVVGQLVAEVAQDHRVALLCLRARGEDPVDAILRERCDIVEEIERPEAAGPWPRRMERAWSLLHGKPTWVAERTVGVFASRLRELARTWKPDIVQFEYHLMGQYLSALDGCPAARVLTEHEVGSSAIRDLRWTYHGLARRLAYPFELIAWQRYEQDVVRRAQAVVAFTERDRQLLATLAPKARIEIIPFGTRIPERPLDPYGCDGRVVFTGSYIHPPNVDAATRLIERIFTRVRMRHSEAVLHVVGDQPPPALRALESDSVIVTGRVPDVTPYLDHAAVVALPLRLGGGMRVKLLEALAAGKAIVASPLAIAGLDVTRGEHLLVAETDDDFVEAVLALLEDSERRASLARRARAWACANLGWAASKAAYAQLYTDLIDERGAC
jgi:glycosyltransferase involved in cell wall biosynthesis